jgi:hypothetical protein
VLRDQLAENKCDIACIQESKLQAMDDLAIASALGNQFVGNYAVLQAHGTCGGIIMACSHDYYELSQVVCRRFSVSASITRKLDNEAWTLTVVYGHYIVSFASQSLGCTLFNIGHTCLQGCQGRGLGK